MTVPIIHQSNQRDPRDNLTWCGDCQHHYFTDRGHHCEQKPRMRLRGMPLAILLGLACWLVAAGGVWLVASRAQEGAVHPIKAPSALLRERAQCQQAKVLETCLRSKLRTAYTALEWARKERNRRDAPYGVQHALRLASALYNVPLSELRSVGTCESHLTPSSKNRSSSASGLFQWLDSTWNRAGIPGFSPFDAYANAIATARLVKSDGSWREWSCQP